MKKYGFFLAIVLSWTFFSCSKDKSYEPMEINYQAKINVNDNNVINDKIDYVDIIGYDSSNYTFLIDSIAINKIRKYLFPSGGLPFYVNVRGETIYFGKFFPGYSNSMPCGITIDPESSLIGNKLTVNIDYGFCRTDNQLVDQRNDKRIIAVLQKDKKLIKIDL
ncbi:MAG: hypothetical protein ABSA76_11110 [Bacteroidales bacterium]